MSIDVEIIERATVGTVTPEAVDEVPGWLLPFDHGALGRAKSAVPLHHDRHEPSEAELTDIIARYQARQLCPQFRLPDLSSLARVHVALGRRNFTPGRSSYVQLIDVTTQPPRALPVGTSIVDAADEAWAAVLCQVPASARDGRARAAAIAQSPHTAYISVREQGSVGAIGAITFARGLGCLHGVRTLPALRGRGLATRVVAACVEAARARRVDFVFAQVEADNEAARAACRRAGLRTLWRYTYWQPASGGLES